MEQHKLLELLTQCQPLAHKLTEQRYEYTLDVADLQFYPVYGQVIAQLPDPDIENGAELLDSLFKQSGITGQEPFWLNIWYEMAPSFQELVSSEQFDSTAVYRPFAERLQDLETLITQLLHRHIIRLGDLDWLSLPAMAEENPTVLPLAEKLLFNRLAWAETGKKDLLSLTAREEALLEFMHACKNTLGMQSLLPPDTRKPSQEKKDPWIRATISAWKITKEFIPGQQSGRWRMRIPRSQVDSQWEAIALATREGKLGKWAQVTTARPPAKNKPPRPDHLIEIVTFDVQNQEETQQIKTTLRELDVTQFQLNKS